MWIKLQVSKALEIGGTSHHYRPGDWVEVGRQSAMVMIAAGEAVIPNQEKLAGMLPVDASVLLTHHPHDGGILNSKLTGMKLAVETHAGGPISLTHLYTLIVHPSAIVKPDLLPVGFHLLEKWQMAVPIGDYHEMAVQIGSQEDRELTKSVIRDLRVPYYDTRMIFARRCADTKELFARWQEEMQALDGKTDVRLAFLRAMYTVKPILCALPTIWTRSE